MSAAPPVPHASPPLFPLGRVVATPHALRVLKAHAVTPLALLQRHVRGDWGELSPEDKFKFLRLGHRLRRSVKRLISSWRGGREERHRVLPEYGIPCGNRQ